MRYYNSASSLFGHDCNAGTYRKPMKRKWLKKNWTPPEWLIKIKIDASRKKNTTESTIIGFVVKDKHDITVMTEEKQTGDGNQIREAIVAECLAMQETFVMVTQKDLQRIIIESDSQLVFNIIYDKIAILKDTDNLCRRYLKRFVPWLRTLV